tara:strand:- start:2590 stop:3090 length:501 start_codon:yes stop_codon:yes gene_type:complete
MSKLIFKVILLLFLTISYSNSNEKVAYIDLDFLFNNSIEGKKIILKLEELKKISIEKIKSKEENLIKLEKDLNQKKNILSEEEFKKKLTNLKSKVVKFRENKNNINMKFEEEKKNQIKFFFNDINPYITKFMEQNQITIIIDKKNIFIGSSKNDITNEILNLINKS